MDWSLWILVHLLLAIVAASIALSRRRWWTAALTLPGAAVGGVLAVVPIFKMMESNAASSGVDSGNVGIFFCCSVPVFPILGMAAAWAVGLALDQPWRAISKDDVCAKCGYSRRGLKQSSACPECGEEYTLKEPAQRRHSARIDRTDYEQ
jgi:predicted RNA-binding Zn-ribbon protein involved in translation (DUF1610 family)